MGICIDKSVLTCWRQLHLCVRISNELPFARVGCSKEQILGPVHIEKGQIEKVLLTNTTTTMESKETLNNKDNIQSSDMTLANMSESQFRDSLDALILNVPAEASGPTTNDTPPVEEPPKPAAPSIPSNVQVVVPTPFITTDQSQVVLPASTVINTNPLTNLQFLLPLPMPPPVSSMPAPLPATSATRKRNSCISEDEEEWNKRRQDRNAREQQRAHQITQQIAALRSLLQTAKRQFKPDKFSTLQATEQYIRKLQSESLDLSKQHQSLLTTLQQTTEHIHKPFSSNTAKQQHCSAEQESQDFCSAINYQWVFHACPMAICLTSIDGRFLDCNDTFQETTRYDRATLLPKEQDATVAQNMSIFNVLAKSSIETVFCNMSKMLSFDNTGHNDSFVTAVHLGRSPQTKVRSSLGLSFWIDQAAVAHLHSSSSFLLCQSTR